MLIDGWRGVTAPFASSVKLYAAPPFRHMDSKDVLDKSRATGAFGMVHDHPYFLQVQIEMQ